MSIAKSTFGSFGRTIRIMIVRTPRERLCCCQAKAKKTITLNARLGSFTGAEPGRRTSQQKQGTRVTNGRPGSNYWV